MSAAQRKAVFAICVLIFVSLACLGGYSNPGTIIETSEDGVLGEFAEPGPLWTPTIRPTRTPKPAQEELTEAELEPPPPIKEGTCAWVRTQDSQNYPTGDVGPNMIVRATDYGVVTEFYHSPGSTSGEQVFKTIHEFFVPQTLIPGETDYFSVLFQWFNTGDPGSSSLVKAGGVTMITVGDYKLKVGRSDINIRTEPDGYLVDESAWKAPEGKVGDKLTITQHASTGSFGVNVRWYYEYICQ